MTRRTNLANLAVLPGLALAAAALVACGSDTPSAEDVTTAADDDAAPVATEAAEDSDTEEVADNSGAATEPADETSTDESASNEGDASSEATASTYEIEVWADNWMAVSVDGELIGEDSVPITTERSFNAETFTFEATAPFTVAIEAKDFKETDSGIEYIGLQNQQMGDGGIIAQITDLTTGEVVAVTDATWSTLVIHQAPLNTECERDADPDATCEFISLDAPDGWTDASFDDSAWASATVWNEADVSPKDGYDEISWDPTAQLVWGTDLEVDNTVLLRTTVS